MNKPFSPDNPKSDEALAAYTDQLMSTSPDAPPPQTSTDPELARLEQMVLRLRATFRPSDPPPLEVSGRIRQTLVKEWQHTPQAKIQSQPVNEPWLERLKDLFGWNTPRRRQHTLTLAFVTVAALTLILTLWLSPSTGTSSAATSSRIPGLVVFGFLLMVAALAYFWDRFHKK